MGLLRLGDLGLPGTLGSWVWVHAGQRAEGPMASWRKRDLWVNTGSMDMPWPGQQGHRCPGEEAAWQPHDRAAGDGCWWDGVAFPRFRSQGHLATSPIFKDVVKPWSQLGKRKTNGKMGTDSSSHLTAKGTPVKRVPGDRRSAEWPQRVHGHASEWSGRGVPGQGLGPESCYRLWGEGDLASPRKPDLAPWHPQTASVPQT